MAGGSQVILCDSLRTGRGCVCLGSKVGEDNGEEESMERTVWIDCL
jgi:hypothetical protein